MRVIDTDNFGGDYPNEKVIAVCANNYWAPKIAELLNEDSGPNASRYYKAVEDDYTLQPGFEP